MISAVWLVLRRVPLRLWLYAAGVALLLGAVAYARHWHQAAIRDGKAFTRDSITAAATLEGLRAAPQIIHDSIAVERWRTVVRHAVDTVRLTSGRVDTAVARLSESAQADSTVRALVSAVTALQADTARLFAAILAERRAVETLQVDMSLALNAAHLQTVAVRDSLHVEQRKPRRTWRSSMVRFMGGVAVGATSAVLIQRRR